LVFQIIIHSFPGFYFFKKWFGKKREPTKFNPLQNKQNFVEDLFEVLNLFLNLKESIFRR
jgi:hypothetical protein